MGVSRAPEFRSSIRLGQDQINDRQDTWIMTSRSSRTVASMDEAVRRLRSEIVACTHCAASLPHSPRPVAQFGDAARILIIGQAPGVRVHESGVPWNDASGARLREWIGLDDITFYDPDRLALMPMGFCYPGKGRSGDLPPRPECAPLWHDRILPLMPDIRLTLLVGSYAQSRYLPHAGEMSLTDRVRRWATFGGNVIPLPHPSWRSTGWMARNPWFEIELIPVLQSAVHAALEP